MAEARLLQLHSIDGRDEIEDFWLRNRDLVFQVIFFSLTTKFSNHLGKNEWPLSRPRNF